MPSSGLTSPAWEGQGCGRVRWIQVDCPGLDQLETSLRWDILISYNWIHMLKGSDLSRSRAEAKKNDFCDVFLKTVLFCS